MQPEEVELVACTCMAMIDLAVADCSSDSAADGSCGSSRRECAMKWVMDDADDLRRPGEPQYIPFKIACYIAGADYRAERRRCVLAAAGGVTLSKKDVSWSRSKKRAKALHSAGLSVDEIADVTGTNRCRIYSMLRASGSAKRVSTCLSMEDIRSAVYARFGASADGIWHEVRNSWQNKNNKKDPKVPM